MKKSKVKNENHFQVQGWMVNELKLKGSELIIYAIIYGFSQDGQSKFTGSLQYLADWTNSTKQNCMNHLKSLIDKDLIEKEELEINNNKYCKYSAKLNTIQNFCIGSKNFCTNNIDNNIDILDNKLSNIENFEKNDFTNLEKEMKEKEKQKKKEKKIKDAILINQILENFTTNEDVLAELKKYLAIRKKKGLSPEQWKIILDDLRKECGTNKAYAIEKIQKAIAGGWMQIVYINNFTGTAKSRYSSKPHFDNTINHELPKAVASMTADEKKNFIDNELARDENGNLIKF